MFYARLERGDAVGIAGPSQCSRDGLEHADGELHEAVGVAPLAVVPGDDLDLGAVDDGWSSACRRSTSTGI